MAKIDQRPIEVFFATSQTMYIELLSKKQNGEQLSRVEQNWLDAYEEQKEWSLTHTLVIK